MPSALDRCRLFGETWSDDKSDLKTPNDLKDLLDKIYSLNMDNIDEAQCRAEYREWVETVIEPEFSRGMAGDWFHDYLDISTTRLQPPHFKEKGRTWATAVD